MTDKTENNYEVGYRRPPVATRYPKGKSGNPKGRPKAAEFDPGRILQAIDNEGIILTVDGKRKHMRKSEMYFRHLFKKALGGDLRAAKLILEAGADYFGPDAEGPRDARFIVMPDEFFNRRETPTADKGNA
jgi:hypothetical protein